MGIDEKDFARFSPWAQKQIAAKLAVQMREKAEKQAEAVSKPKRKYRNTPTDKAGADGKIMRFASAAEARRYDELMLLLASGQIRDLKLQPQFTIQESYVTSDGQRVRAIRYHADFSYDRLERRRYFTDDGELMQETEDWVYVVEDVKGGKATQTDKYKLKKKLMQERKGITIMEVQA